MNKREIAEAMLELGAKCDAVEEAVAMRGGERVDLAPFYAGAAGAFGIAYLALTGQIDEGYLDPTHVMAVMAEHYLHDLDDVDGGEGDE